MSNFTSAAYHPIEKTVRAALWLDDHFGKHEYGVKLSGDDHVYTPHEVAIPLDAMFYNCTRTTTTASTEIRL